MYNIVSVTKVPVGGGCPTPKFPTVIAIPTEFVASEPARELGNVATAGDITLTADGKAIEIYAFPPTIEVTEESDGDAPSRGVKGGCSFEHPGDSAEIAGHVEFARNRGFILLVRDCELEGEGSTYKKIGSVCEPVYLTTEYTNNKDGLKRKLTYKQEAKSRFGISIYKGKKPAVAAEAAAPAENQEGA